MNIPRDTIRIINPRSQLTTYAPFVSFILKEYSGVAFKSLTSPNRTAPAEKRNHQKKYMSISSGPHEGQDGK